MKILMVSAHFNLPDDAIPLGGVQKHISEITKEFSSRGYRVDWCYPGQAKKEISIIKPDLIIAHDFVSFVPDVSMPQITVFHGWEGRVPPDEAVIKRRLEVEKLSSATIAVGDYIRRWYKQSPSLVIYGGVDSSIAYVPTLRKGGLFYNGERRLLYVGRLAPDCSPHIFFRALKKTRNVFTLDICGDGPLRKDLERTANELGIEVEFHGFTEDVNSHIRVADIVLTSGYLSILESYINKRPVISVYDNSLKEDYLKLMPCSPFVCGTSFEVSEKLDFIWEKGIGELKDINYQFALGNSWSRVVDKYEELIRKIT
ncbi:MAG: glycosyltransferase family 4 protein [Candidatus Eremiobacterota bacterium]